VGPFRLPRRGRDAFRAFGTIHGLPPCIAQDKRMNELSHMSREALASALLTPVSAVSDAALSYCAADDTPATQAEIARRLAIAREILLRDLETTFRRRAVLDSPKTVREYLILHYAHLPHEVFGVMFLDTQNRLIEAELQMFRGTLTQTSVYPREVVKAALGYNAAAAILCHVHPSGAPDPSRADELLTAQLKTALAMVDVNVLDHFIVAGAATPVSFAELGLL
jgi:DNA repair protein RadC